MATELNPRSRRILATVVREYIHTGEPVASMVIARRGAVQVSSATIRNILARLEEQGFVRQPHTSSGRVPTDLGYRYYVESIIESVPLPPVEQLMIRHQFGQVEFASEHWFRLAASTIASLTHAAGLATPAKPAAARVRRVDLVSINDRMASLVVILREGSIKQSLVSLGDTEDQAALTSVAAILNDLVGGGTAAEVEELREAIATVVGGPSDGSPAVPNGWTTRYAARRIAWHVLEHAWEMQDRAESQVVQPG
jgi:heat-inducible transcriptional repressor